MKPWRICLLSVPLMLAWPAAQAHAQGFVGSCARIIWQFVGKPLTEQMLKSAGEEGGKLLVDHFASRMREQSNGRTGGSRPITITQDDIAALQEEYESRNMTQCELRQQLEAMYQPASPMPAPMFTERRQMPVASVCMTQAGTCMMQMPVPVGGSCVCSTMWGMIPGIAQ